MARRRETNAQEAMADCYERRGFTVVRRHGMDTFVYEAGEDPRTATHRKRIKARVVRGESRHEIMGKMEWLSGQGRDIKDVIAKLCPDM